MSMKTVNESKKIIYNQISNLCDEGNFIYSGYPEPLPQLLKLSSAVIDFNCPEKTELTLSDGSQSEGTVKQTLKTVLNNQYELYIRGKKISVVFDKDKVRKMYFDLRRLYDDICEVKTVENICDTLEELGKEDARKRKVSKLGRHYLEEEALTSNTLTRFQKEFKTKLSIDEYAEFKEAYILGYDSEKAIVNNEKEEKLDNRRHGSQSVESTYIGDVAELTSWIKKHIVSVNVIIPEIYEDDDLYELTTKKGIIKTAAEIKQKVIDSTKTLVDDAISKELLGKDFQLDTNAGIWAAWKIKLDSSCQDDKPKAVDTWIAKKKQAKSLDEWVDGPVFKNNCISSNAIVKDLIFNYQVTI